MAGPSRDVLGLAERRLPLPRPGAEELVVLQQRRRGLEERELAAVLLVGSQPGQVVIEVREPGRVVAGRRLRLQHPVGAGPDDVHPGGDVRPRRGDQLVVAADGHRVDPAVAAGPGLVDRVGLRRPVIEVPGPLQALADLDEGRLHRVRLLRSLHLEGVPPLLVQSDVLAVASGPGPSGPFNSAT